MKQAKRAEADQRAWRQACDDIIATVTALRDPGAALIERAAIPVRDGFASGRGYEGEGGRTTRDAPRNLADLLAAWEKQDEDGIDPDPVTTAVLSMRGHIRDALTAVLRARDARNAAVFVPASEQLHEPHKAPGCVNCDRFDIWSVVYKAGRCQACYAWRRRHDGTDAPEHIVQARPENSGRRRMTAADQVLDEAG